MGHGTVILAADNNFMGAMEEYFELSLRTENLCTSLREFVKKCRDDQIIIDRALVIKEAQILLSEEDCKEITGELRIVRGELICVEEFESVQKRHAKMQSQLGIVQRNVDKKIKSCNIAVTVVERLSLQDLYEGDGGLESQSVLVEEMKLGTVMSCKDVETMRVLIDRLHAEILVLYSCPCKIFVTKSLNSLSIWRILKGKHTIAMRTSPRLELFFYGNCLHV